MLIFLVYSIIDVKIQLIYVSCIPSHYTLNLINEVTSLESFRSSRVEADLGSQNLEVGTKESL